MIVGKGGGEIFGRIDNLCKQGYISDEKFWCKRAVRTHNAHTTENQNNHHQGDAHNLAQRGGQIHLTIYGSLYFCITLVTFLKGFFRMPKGIKSLNDTET